MEVILKDNNFPKCLPSCDLSYLLLSVPATFILLLFPLVLLRIDENNNCSLILLSFVESKFEVDIDFKLKGTGTISR